MRFFDRAFLQGAVHLLDVAGVLGTHGASDPNVATARAMRSAWREMGQGFRYITDQTRAQLSIAKHDQPPSGGSNSYIYASLLPDLSKDESVRFLQLDGIYLTYHRLTERFPENPVYWLHLADASYELGLFAEVVRAYDAALSLRGFLLRDGDYDTIERRYNMAQQHMKSAKRWKDAPVHHLKTDFPGA